MAFGERLFSNTSSAAPRMRRAVRASTSAVSSTTGPRPMFTNTPVGFMAAIASRETRPRVSGVSGRATTT